MTFGDNLADERLSAPQAAAHRDEGGRSEPVPKKIREVRLVNALHLSDVRLQVGMLLAIITFVTACAPSNTATPLAAPAATAGTGANSGSTPAAPTAATVTMSDALRFEQMGPPQPAQLAGVNPLRATRHNSLIWLD